MADAFFNQHVFQRIARRHPDGNDNLVYRLQFAVFAFFGDNNRSFLNLFNSCSEHQPDSCQPKTLVQHVSVSGQRQNGGRWQHLNQRNILDAFFAQKVSRFHSY